MKNPSLTKFLSLRNVYSLHINWPRSLILIYSFLTPEGEKEMLKFCRKTNWPNWVLRCSHLSFHKGGKIHLDWTLPWLFLHNWDACCLECMYWPKHTYPGFKNTQYDTASLIKGHWSLKCKQNFFRQVLFEIWTCLDYWKSRLWMMISDYLRVIDISSVANFIHWSKELWSGILISRFVMCPDTH